MNMPRPALAVALLSALVAPAFHAAAPAALPSASSGAVVIKIASIAPSRSPWDKALEQVARDWERISNGAVQVRIYPGSIAGSEQDMIRKMRLGTIQGGVFSNMGLVKIDHSLMVLSIPFLFHTRDEFNAVFDRMKPGFEKTIEDKGYKMMLWTLAGWVNFFSKSKVVDPDDLKKLKVSVTADFPELEQVWKRMGYEVVTSGGNEQMIQLQSGAASAAYLPPLLAASGQSFALLPHMFSPSLAPLVGGLILSDKAWEAVPAEFRQPFLDAVASATKGLYEETMRLEADAVKMMKDNGLVVHDPSAAALAKWYEAAGRAVDGLIGPVFSKESYDRVVRYVQEFRQARGQ